MTSDAELVARTRSGDLDAFGQLIARYEKTLLAAVLSQYRDVHLAEDVVQAALLRAFQRLETLRDEAQFGAWLIQIARRGAVDATRARRTITSPYDEARCGAVCEEGVDTWIEHEHLLDLLGRLPERERVLVGLRYFDGHSVAQISEILSRPVGTVTKQLSRTIARLRSWWDKEDLQ